MLIQSDRRVLNVESHIAKAGPRPYVLNTGAGAPVDDVTG